MDGVRGGGWDKGRWVGQGEVGGTSGRCVGWVGQGEVSATMGGGSDKEMGRRCGWVKGQRDEGGCDKGRWVGQEEVPLPFLSAFE